jgi:hypothetical protein
VEKYGALHLIETIKVAIDRRSNRDVTEVILRENGVQGSAMAAGRQNPAGSCMKNM